MKAITTLSLFVLLCACQHPPSQAILPKNSQDSTQDASTKTRQEPSQTVAPIPPTAHELLTELKTSDVWQSLPLTYDNLSDDWRLLVVSDTALNDLDLPIVKKQPFSVEFSKSPIIKDYYSVSMPNNCNGMGGRIVLTGTGINTPENLPTTQMSCEKPPSELDDDIVHQAIIHGKYQILEKGKQRILKLTHDGQYWFFYAHDPMYHHGLLKSFNKDRHDWHAVSYRADDLLGDWRLYAIGDNQYHPIHLDLWQKNGNERYQISFNKESNDTYFLSMPNDCNHMSIPFIFNNSKFAFDFDKTISTQAKCGIPKAYKNADESIIHNALYHGNYQLMENDDGKLLKVAYDGQVLFFVSEAYNQKQHQAFESGLWLH